MATTYSVSPVAATDRAGIVWVAAILSLMFAIITLATRFQIKFHTLGKDDWLIAGATIVALGQFVAVYVGLHQGLGQSTLLLSQSHAAQLAHAVLASEIFFIVTMMLSKLGVIFFMKRLFTREHRTAWWCCNAAVALTIIWGVASVSGVSIGCGSWKMLYGPARCDGKLARWTVVISTDAAREVVYVALAVVLVWPLQMRLSIKVTVVMAFGFRLVCAIFAALHRVWIAKYVQSPDPGLAVADVLVWQQVALGYSLIATTIPTIKNFVRGYNQAMGWDPSSEKRGLGGGYNLASHVRSGGRSRIESSSKRGSGSRNMDRPEDQLQLRPNVGDYRVGAFHDSSKGKTPRRLSTSGSNESEDPIIRRQISVTIEHEQASRANSSNLES
ncbi:hypothetical protein CLAFUW4_03191 [Fulvia fulva]|uniref:Rhodopsin domain-containing protein n=1 Tax=Passalora fulva TaxID=5499 RepID=A0A9Q8P5B7_PASFU|nr:uncharacterized protein CLAFUR5_03175 [Fulvia fulva]KAK4632895.1 hypothetical protein CLAFUR0_03184 [Fulvia fulva]UJO13843.1 hypothetical protein CLAFUR5_03175 [Fulvia fulva]WPV10532.1 hypothetical protein CLAFUW4_03191 [Fulvia fulva]